MAKSKELQFWKPKKLERIYFIEPEDYIEVEDIAKQNKQPQWEKSDHIGDQKIKNYSICTKTGRLIVHSKKEKCIIYIG